MRRRHIHINGRRGAFLAIFGVIYAAIGSSYLSPPPSSTVRQTLAWVPFPHALQLVGVAFIVAGIVAGVSAFHTLPSDRVGFEVLSGVTFAWAALEVLSWGLGYAGRGWVSGLIFGLLAVTILTVSGMPNPPHGRIP